MLNDDEGKSILSISFNNTDLDAYVVEFKIATLKDCEVWGKYGINGVPDDKNHDVYIKTRGSGRMSKITPKDLIVNFQSSLLKITVKNVNYPQNTTTDPLTFILRCEGNELVFKSTFFGSFSAQAFFIGPTPIQFDEIFLNFDDRLAESPHVLATFFSVIVLSVLAVIPLRRADKRDKIYWTYLPLIDNPDEGHSIFLSVQTSTSSPRTMSANVYIELVGTTGRTGPRILSDGVRQNFCRGTSSHFVLVTSASIGKLKKLIIWHDNGGKNPRWCLSKVVVLEEETKEKYMFLCQEWLCLDCDDGQTWRRLHPTITEIMDDNIVFRESSRKRFYDDFLWISLIHRPNYSVFTRVQRLWTLIGMLFLAMLTSAMWYDTSQNESSTAFGNLKIGPFTFSYRQIYVGVVSSFISLLPSLIVISIFKYRRLRGDANSTEDIWTWLKEYYIPAIWPKFNTANKPLSAYQQRFLSDQLSYRLGHTRMRQARVHGNCTVDPVMAEEVKICKHDYTLAQESNINYCPGWKPFNVSCFEYEDNNQANEEIDASFLYFNSTSTKSLYHFGKFAIYDGGGYTIYLGPKQSIVMDYVEQLRALGWIDLNTRVLFIDTNSFNPSTRLFSHTQTVFEMSAFGDVIRKSETYSMNLYPYVTISDFIILALQLLFCVILCIKIVRLFREGYLYRFGCLRRFVFYCDVFDILLGLAALVSFILRILCSIEAIEDIRNDMSKY
ncbi:hypothetical protein FSP39_021931 [Pinctada imbricata]|uniref:PLAT domain-containing protein n=1 Tax=Pinctada imbricata TaxID=66713 RepID=A0AA88XGL4_PINIB|nr:hypothetical protein FSP39_021931 [Pinctada imbricata]